MKKIKAIILSLAAVLCAGCADLEGSSPSGSVVFIDSDTVSGNMTSPIPVSAGIYAVKNSCFTEDHLLSLFDGEPERTEEERIVRFELGETHGYINSAGSVGFYTDDGDRFDSARSYLELEGDYGAYMDDTSELDFATRDEARADVLAVFVKLGFSAENVEIKQQYSVKKSGYDHYKDACRGEAENADDSDRERAQKRAENAAKTKSRDYYYFETTLKQDGIPFYSDKPFEYSDRIDDCILGTNGSVVYTEKGIEYMSLLCHYKVAEPSEKAELITPSEAQKLVSEKFGGSFIDGETEVSGFELVYLAFFENTASEVRETGQLRPSYAFHCRLKNDGNTSEFSVFFDAVSGKEIGTSW